MPMCKIYDELECIECDYCKAVAPKLELKEYLLVLVDKDIEKIEDELRIFTVLTHTTKEQQAVAYRIIFKLQDHERLKEELINLLGE